ncbi:MAG: hypothetical protein LUD51_02045 [Clostridia bacterium]|nr:hypothetical protein [Clostridia bacterium]
MCKPDSNKFHGTEGDPDPLYYTKDNPKGQELINEVKEKGFKISEDKILGITRNPATNQVVWLEDSSLKAKAGFGHIQSRHLTDFILSGIGADEIIDAIFTAITKGTITGYEHKSDPKHIRPVYEYIFNGETHSMAITISDNGYIVGANPK